MTDREYREIQLSTKQVVFLGISVIVMAVVIFLLGVAVGRDVRGTDVPVSAAMGTETLVPDEPPVQPAQELSYHDLLAGPAGAGTTTAPPDIPPPDPVPTPVVEAPPPPAPASPTTGDWFLQVGAFSGRQAADGLVANLKKLEVPAFVLVPGAGAADRLFRVRVGPYGTQADAEAVRVRLVREGFQPRVTR
jgi:cell division protein FtsN